MKRQAFFLANQGRGLSRVGRASTSLAWKEHEYSGNGSRLQGYLTKLQKPSKDDGRDEASHDLNTASLPTKIEAKAWSDGLKLSRQRPSEKVDLY